MLNRLLIAVALLLTTTSVQAESKAKVLFIGKQPSFGSG